MGLAFDYSSLKSNDQCLVIAEAGSNHDQDKQNAFELVQVAADSGADAVKFQLFTADKLYSKSVSKEIYEATKKAELPLDWIPEIIDKCKSNEIMFLGTPFDIDSIDILDNANVPMFKWASGEIDNIDLLRYAAKKSKPMIISTGMCDMSTIEAAIDTVVEENNNKIALLHCISIYPTRVEDVNLRMMDTLSNAFGYPIGFSDHTIGSSVPIAAVARGAKILEKHFTLNKNLKSPDHPFSLRPNELKDLVTRIREVSSSLGKSQKQIIENEKPIAKIAKRSIVASQFLSKGTKLNADTITTKRPGTGILPRFSPFIIGRSVNKDIMKDQVLNLDDFI
jgi:sialic acid synthase SpsE